MNAQLIRELREIRRRLDHLLEEAEAQQAGEAASADRRPCELWNPFTGQYEPIKKRRKKK